MALEIRNFKPSGQSSGVSVNSNIMFDIIATDGDQIDIATLQVEILMISNIDGESNSIFYNVIPTGYAYGYNFVQQCGDEQDFFNAIASSLSFEGSCIHYKIELDPAQPFDLAQSVDVTVRVSDTDGNAMSAFTSSFVTMQTDLISEFSLIFIPDAMRIPVHHETLRKTNDLNPQTFFSFCGNWNIKPAPIVRYNEVIIDPEGTSFSPSFSIDYEKGRIIFSEALDPEDLIDVSYVFRLFDDEQINLFFQQATSIYRVNPQFGGPATIHGADLTTRNVIMLGAAMFAYRALLSSLAYQEKRLIFDNHSWEDGWKQIMDLFRGLYEAYSKDWERVLEAKSVRLPRIASVVTPEFTLPGGRSRLFRFLYKGGNG